MAQPWFRVLPPENPKNLRFNEAVGPKEMPDADAPPVSYFHLLFTSNLLREIVRQTNRYARHFINSHVLSQFSRSRAWVPVSISEMRAFLAVVINMGLIRKPTITEYRNKADPTQNTPWFRKVFSRNRFQQILKFFHIVDNRRLPHRNSPVYRPHLRFKPLLDFVNRMFVRHYTPSQNLAVDETLIGTRGRTCMLQYIPSKRAKFGVKFWVLAESSTGYILRMNCYLGKTFERVIGLQGTSVVMELMKQCDLFHKGYHVTVDSFFGSLDLAKQLLLKRTFMTGTLRANRPMPLTIKNANPMPYTSVCMRKGEILVVAHRTANHRKPVRLVSTAMHADTATGKPAVIKHYNKNMGGVDEADMLLSYYNAERKTVKVWKKMAFNIIFRLLLNAYVLYKQNTSDTPKSRLRFIQHIVASLAEDHMQHRQGNRARRLQMHELQRIPGSRQKDCVVKLCSNRNHGRRRSLLMCTGCHRGCHRHCWRVHRCLLEE